MSYAHNVRKKAIKKFKVASTKVGIAKYAMASNRWKLVSEKSEAK